MKSRYLFLGVFLCIVAIVAIMQYAPQNFMWLIYLASTAALLMLLLLWRSVLMPAQTVVRGMELIRSQDFNNRLRPVHEADSDKIVDLFNQMIDTLRNERLYNREQDGFLKLLIEASPMGVVMLDFDGKITLVNRSFQRLTRINDLNIFKGNTIQDLPSPLAVKMLEVPLGGSRIIRQGDIKQYRCYHLNFLQMGFQRRFYLLESLTEEVMRAERAAYEKVIRIISHEVNNTMGGVRSVLETLHDICEEGDLKEVIESCDNRCNQMCNFISSYADVVRVPEPVLKRVELNTELKKMIPFLLELVPENIKLIYTPAEKDITVMLDLTLIQQVVVNIIKNAVESITDNGIIEIKINQIGNCATLIISNNGKPITDEISGNLFSPFFTTKREGRGLGLTLICEILNRHKAQFSLITGADLITRFSIIFP